MTYTLKHFDTDLLRFSAEPQSSSPEYKILWVNEEKKHLLPLDFEISAKGLEQWIKHRNIPKNRAFVDTFLAKCGLSANRPLGIISVSKGLSLNDCYWVAEEGFDEPFARVNLYDNRFSNILGYVAFTGYGSSPRSTFTSSPEFTTNGMLPKCWRRINGDIVLYKGGTSGASNTGYEPYSEYYASQIAKALGIEAVLYGLSRWKGILCSTCKLFTSKDVSFMPVGKLVTEGCFEAVYAYYEKLGTKFTDALQDMLVFDAVIKNTDRHFGNFGFMVDSHTNKIVAPAPLFDHGNSMYSLAGLDSFDSIKDLQNYDNSLQPRVYDGFVETARRYITKKSRQNLHKMADFSFKRHPRYNLPDKRLRLIEQLVRQNAAKLVE